jgi:hypothetical protein
LQSRWIAAQEAPPQAAFLDNCREGVGQAHRHLGRNRGLTAPERSADRFDQGRPVEAKDAGRNPDVVKVLDPAVRFSIA